MSCASSDIRFPTSCTLPGYSASLAKEEAGEDEETAATTRAWLPTPWTYSGPPPLGWMAQGVDDPPRAHREPLTVSPKIGPFRASGANLGLCCSSLAGRCSLWCSST